MSPANNFFADNKRQKQTNLEHVCIESEVAGISAGEGLFFWLGTKCSASGSSRAVSVVMAFLAAHLFFGNASDDWPIFGLFLTCRLKKQPSQPTVPCHLLATGCQVND